MKDERHPVYENEGTECCLRKVGQEQGLQKVDVDLVDRILHHQYCLLTVRTGIMEFKYTSSCYNFVHLCIGARVLVGSYKGHDNVVKVILMGSMPKFDQLKYGFKITKLK